VRKGERAVQPLGRVQLKSAIAFPDDGARLPAGRQLIWGFAWGADPAVRGVTVSTDGGRSWRPARLDSAPDPFRWTRWSLEWEAASGDYALVSRAEGDGESQPLARDAARDDGYELNQCARVTCSVR
jgi:hypothetical protein